MHLLETSTTEEFLKQSVQWIEKTIRATADEVSGTVFVGLAGGTTPQAVYEKISLDASLPWERVTLFLTDERYIPSSHKDSNQRMIRESLLQHEAARANFLAPDTSLPLDQCISDYAKILDEVTPDLIILGMGPDGHTASLFPPLTSVDSEKTVIHTTTDVFAVHDRISVSMAFLLSAKKRVFLITGKEKKAVLQKIQQKNIDVNMCPAGAFTDDETLWIIGL